DDLIDIASRAFGPWNGASSGSDGRGAGLVAPADLDDRRAGLVSPAEPDRRGTGLVAPADPDGRGAGLVTPAGLENAADANAFLASPRLAIVARESAAQSELRIGHLSARRDTPDYPALLVMNAVLGGQFVSRVNLKLREEKGYTYGARTGFDWRIGLAPFTLQASVHTAATADAVRDSLNELD